MIYFEVLILINVPIAVVRFHLYERVKESISWQYLVSLPHRLINYDVCLVRMYIYNIVEPRFLFIPEPDLVFIDHDTI